MPSTKKLLLLLCLITTFACENRVKNSQTTRPIPQRKYDQAQEFSYTVWSIKNDSLRKKFKASYSTSALATIAALNRQDLQALRATDSLVVPNRIDSDFLAYSAFPFTLSSLFDVPKIAIFSYRIQAYGLYEYGELIKWGPASLGSKANQTPRGLFFLQLERERSGKHRR